MFVRASQFDLYIHKYVCLVGAFICNKGLLQFLYHCVQCLHRVMLTSSGGKCGQSRALDNQLGPREHKGGSRQFGSPMSQVNYGLGLRLRVWRKLKMIPKGQDANMPATLAPPCWLHMTKVARLVRLVSSLRKNCFFFFETKQVAQVADTCFLRKW